MDQEHTEKKKKSGKSMLTKGISFLLCFGLGFASAFLVFQKHPSLLGTQTATQQSAESEAKTLLADVAKLMTLPTDETPTIATVTDTEKLPKQSIFSKAQNGDKVIIYAGTKRVILYRPGENRIVDVGIVAVTTPTPSGSPLSSATPSASPTATPATE